MRQLLLLMMLFGSLQLASAQRHSGTLFGHYDVTGAFGSPLVEIDQVAGINGTNTGGGGALVLERIFFGGYGMGGTYDNVDVLINEQMERYDVRIKHGGLWFGYTPGSHKVIHPYSSLKVGWGSGRLQREGSDTIKDRIFVLQPELGIELNITDFFRIAGTANYRMVSGITDLANLTNDDFRGFSAGITFRIGGFDEFDWDDDDW